MLSDSTLDDLAAMLSEVEKHMVFPERASAVTTRLIGARRRPIALYPSVHRIWGKIRRAEAEKWENETGHRGYCNAAAGKHVAEKSRGVDEA